MTPGTPGFVDLLFRILGRRPASELDERRIVWALVQAELLAAGERTYRLPRWLMVPSERKTANHERRQQRRAARRARRGEGGG